MTQQLASCIINIMLMKIFMVLLIIALITWIALSIQSKKLDRERKSLLKERDELSKKGKSDGN